MKTKTAFILVVAVALAGLGFKNATPEEPAKKDGIFIHVSSGYDNPHKVVMALTLAEKFTETHDVMVFFDIKGVEVLTADAEAITMENFTSSKVALENLIASGATVAACPMCMKKAGINLTDLMPGIEVAQKEKFFDFTEGRILSIDY